jgi:hypothetical protein
MTAPTLPAEISPDGREVWDWAGKLSEHTHRLDRIRKLRARIIVIGSVCGDCDKWMKSSQCPREVSTMSGYNKGPSCGEFKCNSFVESVAATKLRDELSAELSTELAATPPAQSGTAGTPDTEGAKE